LDSVAKISILGGTGYAGAHIAAEAVARGHAVTSFSRSRPDKPVHAEGGPLLADTPDFPEPAKPLAREAAAVLEDLKASPPSLDWFLVSPAAMFSSRHPGQKRGTYRLGGDLLLTDTDGKSYISGQDFAVAMVDEIESHAHSRARFTVAY
jgi:putative NADH-flavin reductase